jgi:ornithine carbamoyltransferase
MSPKKKDLLSMADLNAAELGKILDTARALKSKRAGRRPLAGRSLGMIFEKPSTRTSVSFAVAMYELGGQALTLDAKNMQMGRGETMSDTARTLSRYLAALMVRAHRHEDVAELARAATIPVINGLTDKEHPCQVLADLQTVREVFRLSRMSQFKGLRVAYVGDGNNMCHSWLIAAGILGLDFTAACPRVYRPEESYVAQARRAAAVSGGRVTVTEDPRAAAKGAAVLYTDVWTSMGHEAERAARVKVLRPFQVNAALLQVARRDAVVMHCLPAHRGEEVTADVLDGPRSVVFDQAENRLHVQKAVLLHCLGLSA